jgi:RNA polymerase sporulation-specific sigma factor
MALQAAWVPRPDLRASSDEQLVLCARQGSVEALEQLLGRYKGLVDGKARAFFLAGAESEDVVQEGMVGLIKAVRDFSPTRLCSFRSFAELCVTRQIISAVKAARRQKHLALNWSVSLDTPATGDDEDSSLGEAVLVAEAAGPERVMLGRAVLRAMDAVIGRELSSLELRALLGHVSGLTYRQVARQIGCSVKQIDNALQRAKKKIAKGIANLL